MNLRIVYAAASGALLLGTFAFICFAVPPAQREAGTWAQKIFYFHVSSAMISFGLFFGGMLSGIGWLAWKDARMSWASRSMVEVGWFVSTLVLLTGPIWAKPVWGKYWNWEPRLTSFAFLWFAYAAYLLLGPAVEDRDKRRSLQAVYATLAFLSVPIVIYSTRFVPVSDQLHPPRIEMSGRMLVAWGLALVSLSVFFLGVVHLRYSVERLTDTIADLKARRYEGSFARG